MHESPGSRASNTKQPKVATKNTTTSRAARLRIRRASPPSRTEGVSHGRHSAHDPAVGAGYPRTREGDGQRADRRRAHDGKYPPAWVTVRWVGHRMRTPCAAAWRSS